MATTLRRTQAERTAETTARLLAATTEALAEVGYRAASTNEIARRAGVSRGAMVHHFPTRAALFTAAAEALVEESIARFRREMAAIADQNDRLMAATDLLWEILSSPSHRAWIELSTTARHEPDLTDAIERLTRRNRARVRETWTETFPEIQDSPLAAFAPDFTVSLLEGLALSQSIAPEPDVARAVLDGLKAASSLLEVADLELPSPTPAPENP